MKRGCGFIVSGSGFFFVEFDSLDLEIFVICWIESVDPVDDLCLFIVMSQYTNSQKLPLGFS